MTGAHDQSLVSSHSDWSTKFCKLFLRVADKLRQIFARKDNCPTKNWIKAVKSDLNQVKKKMELCCDVKRKEVFAQICRR